MNNVSFLNVFFENQKKNPHKVISKDYKNSLTWERLFNKANYFAIKFKEIDENIIPIIVDRTVNTPAAIVGCILAKNICPISSEQPINRINKILNQLEIQFVLNLEILNYQIFIMKFVKLILKRIHKVHLII